MVSLIRLISTKILPKFKSNRFMSLYIVTFDTIKLYTFKLWLWCTKFFDIKINVLIFNTENKFTWKNSNTKVFWLKFEYFFFHFITSFSSIQNTLVSYINIYISNYLEANNINFTKNNKSRFILLFIFVFVI